VYDLTVEGAHEFVANGVVVSNCDGTLYGWRAATAFVERPEAVKPVAGTPEADALAAKEAQDRRRDVAARGQGTARERWRPSGQR
jgi:hypothetical protein